MQNCIKPTVILISIDGPDNELTTTTYYKVCLEIKAELVDWDTGIRVI